MRLFSPALAAIVVALALPAAAGPPAAGPRAARPGPRRIEVTVVDIAGGVAYVEPGEAAGLRPGDRVSIGRARLVVVAVAKGGAALELGKATVTVGDRGAVRVRVAAPEEVGRLPPPRPLEVFRGQWRRPRVPAASQSPRLVPLGRPGEAGALRGALFAHAEMIAPDGGESLTTGWLGGRVAVEPFGPTTGLDAEGALLLWDGEGLAGPAAVHRRAQVRELRLRWGSAADPRIALGRLRWASALAGPLDGARLSTSVGSLSLAGWGGFLPDAISGRPSPDAGSFGIEAAYDHPEKRLRPRLAVSALGTTFDGALDERKLAAAVDVQGAHVGAGGYLELAGFPGDDPWNAPTIELAAAGAVLRAAADALRGELSAGVRRPERSRRLAALLPAEWLCRPSPRPPGEVEPCADAPLRGELSAGAGLTRGRLRVDAGASVYRAEGADLDVEATGFGAAGLGELGGIFHIDLDADAGRIDAVDWVGGGGELGAALWRDRIDVSARYHAALLRFAASIGDEIEHRAGGRVRLELPVIELSADAEVVRGGGADALIGVLNAIWRLP